MLHVAVFAFVAAATAQFVAQPTGFTTATGFLDIPVRYKEVPAGMCELTPGVRSFSGYVDIAERQHNFFWFFESRNVDPKNAPLTVWINGGPGSSSMIGLFQENGPCTVNVKNQLEYNPYSWNNLSNMLFIDQPTQTGFSYNVPVPAYVNATTGAIVPLPDHTCPEAANGTCGTYSSPVEQDTANSTLNAAPQFWRTLQGFLGAFPQYNHKDFHFATESYGGHYSPIFSKYIVDQNQKIKENCLPGAKYIDLKTALIGNGWFDPLTQYAAYYNFTVNPGNTYVDFYNQSTKDSLYKSMYGKGQCYDQTVECSKIGNNQQCADADNFCLNNVELVYDNVLNRDEYDLREKVPDPFPYANYVNYLNTEKVQHAIGALTNFTESSPTVGNAFGSTGDDDREEGTIAASKELLHAGVYTVHYYGDADYTCNWVGGEAVADEINALGYKYAGYQNMSTSDKLWHGQVKQSGNFAFVRIFESGHEVPFYQPLAAYELFERAISGHDIAEGKFSWLGTLTRGPKKSTYREGGETVQNTTVPLGTTYNTTTDGPGVLRAGKQRRDRLFASLWKHKRGQM